MRRRTSGENVLRLIRIRLNLRCRLMPYSQAAYRTLVVPTLEASELYFSGSFARENRRLRHMIQCGRVSGSSAARLLALIAAVLFVCRLWCFRLGEFLEARIIPDLVPPR